MSKILLEVYFPQTRTSYDVSAIETLSVGELKYIVVCLIEKITSKTYFEKEDFCLYDYDSEELLIEKKYLFECGIKNGSKLLLL